MVYVLHVGFMHGRENVEKEKLTPLLCLTFAGHFLRNVEEKRTLVMSY